MISLLGPGVILFIFILWLMMPPADYIKLWARVPAQTREHSHTGLAGLTGQAQEGCKCFYLRATALNMTTFDSFFLIVYIIQI